MEELSVGEKIGDTSPKDNEVVGEFIPSPNKKEETDEEGQPLGWLVQK